MIEKDNLNISIEEFLNSKSVRDLFAYFDKLKKSKGATKVTNYFLNISATKEFQDEIKKIRIKYAIPENGFAKKDEGLIDGVSWYPEKWKYSEAETKDLLKFFEDEDRIEKKFHIPSGNGQLLDKYIIYNELTTSSPEIGGLCIIQDCDELGRYPITDEKNNTDFPILIRVSPYASQREIIDYIKVVHMRQIKSLQKKYSDEKVKLGKVRTRKKAKRNDSIHKLRKNGLSIKEIRKTLVKDNEFLDDGNIGKILSIERKRRN